MNPDYELLIRLTESPDLMAKVASKEGQGLKLQTQLRKQFDPELVRGALTLSELRTRASARHVHADKMWFSRQELEQATPDLIAEHKAKRFAAAGSHVFDLYCGFGANSIGFAKAGLNVTARETSEIAALRTRLNAEVYGVADRIKTEVVANPIEGLSAELIHIHPQRTATGQKAVKLEDHIPNQESLQSLVEHEPGGAITLSSASNFGGKFNQCEVELVSLNGDCREAIVWFGSLRGEHAMRATILPQGFTLSGNPWESVGMVGPLETYLYDPDPAIVRAGLLDKLTEELSLNRLDAAEEYLTSGELIHSPAAACYEVLTDLPNNDRDIRNYFREAEIGEVEIRCRHVPVDAAALRRKLPLKGKNKVTLFFARLDGKTRAVIGRRITAS